MTMNASAFARIHDPSPDQVDRCIREHRPVVFTGMMSGQPAARWDLPELTERLGQRPVAVVRQPSPRVVWDPQRGLPLQDMPFASFVDQVFRQGEAGISYLQDDINSFPTLRADYRLPEVIERKGIVRAKFWLSGRGPITPLHYDPVETLHWLIRGHKRFLLFPPGTRRYYPHPARSTAPFISQVDPDHPDPTRFPRFRREAGQPLVLEAGDVLYLPSFWWHQVYSQGATNLSLNFVWLVSWLRSARHLGQYVRSRAHLRRGRAKAEAKAAAAAQEMM
jgi:hypothetical protein